jgi:hypothetical protein
MTDGPGAGRSTPQPILELFGGYPMEITADSTDAALQEIAERVGAEFPDHPSMTGAALDFLLLTRKRARDRVRMEAADAGRRVNRLQQDLQTERANRNTLVDQVIAWREPPEWEDGEPNYARIAGLASMSRQGARTTFSTVTEQPTP